MCSKNQLGGLRGSSDGSASSGRIDEASPSMGWEDGWMDEHVDVAVTIETKVSDSGQAGRKGPRRHGGGDGCSYVASRHSGATGSRKRAGAFCSGTRQGYTEAPYAMPLPTGELHYATAASRFHWTAPVCPGYFIGRGVKNRRRSVAKENPTCVRASLIHMILKMRG